MKKLFLLLSIALVLVACGNQVQQPIVTVPPSQEPVPTGETSGVTTGQGGVATGGTAGSAPAEQDIVMDVHEFVFSPSSISVQQGAKVVITLTNSGSATHGFALPDFGINQVIQPGETQTITFIASKTGTFRFFCSVPCGPGHRGMIGTITVQ